LGTVRSKASSLRANLEHSLKEAVYNHLSWIRANGDNGVNNLIKTIISLSIQQLTVACKAE